MKAITLKNFPEDLLRQLKERAKNNSRSLNSEIIHILQSVYPGKASREEMMNRAKKIRATIAQRLSDRELDTAKQEGRL